MFILFAILFRIDIDAAKSPQNIIHSFEQMPIRLQHWMVAEDRNPLNELIIPPDSSWIPVEKIYGIKKYNTGNWLIRTNILIKDSINRNIVQGLFPNNFITAYVIFWDGIKIYRNGSIGISKDTEVPGIFWNDVIIPIELLKPGNHTVLIKISNYNDNSSWKWYNGFCTFGSYRNQFSQIYGERYRSFLIAGILLIPFLFNLFLYFTRKHKIEHLLFSICCLDVMVDFLLSQAPIFTKLSTTYIHWASNIYSGLLILNSITFPLFLIFMFSLSKKWTIPFVFIINIFIFFFFTTYWNMFQIMPAVILIQSSFITLWAVIHKKEGSIIILSGIIIAWAGYFYNFTYANLITVMVICTSLSIAKQFARTEKMQKQAMLRSTRLENELLKKNINPHFLMNTLTSIIVWLRKEPECAVNLIEALADEFRMITQISNLQLIPISQEIELCNAHLKIMSYRKGSDFKLETIDIKEDENIPPMIFHTLIENGITHGYGKKDKGTFTLKRNNLKDNIEYIISNDGEFSDTGKKNSNGMGLQYVEARLEESFPGRWKLTSEKRNSSWQVSIVIKK